MLEQDGSITFTSELVQIVDAFLTEYEARQGPLRNELERGLVISYILGIMRCELESLWDCLAGSSVFGSLHPRVVFDDCTQRNKLVALDRNKIRDMLVERGWLSE